MLYVHGSAESSKAADIGELFNQWRLNIDINCYSMGPLTDKFNSIRATLPAQYGSQDGAAVYAARILSQSAEFSPGINSNIQDRVFEENYRPSGCRSLSVALLCKLYLQFKLKNVEVSFAACLQRFTV